MRRIIICFLLCVARLVFGAAGIEQKMASADGLRQQILQRRSPPLTNLDVRVHLNVRDFGAVPDDGKDDRSAVAAAVAKARSMEGPVQIDFEPGTYDFMAATPDFSYPDNSNVAVSLLNCTNLIVDGHGAEILLHRQDVSFAAVNNSANQIIRDFSVDYDPLPFSQGTVRSVDTSDGSFVFELQPGFPAPDDPVFKNCDSWGMLKDMSHPGRLKADAPSFIRYKEVQSLGEGQYRITLVAAGETAAVSPGDGFVIVARAAGIGRYNDSNNVTFDRITAYASPGPIFIGEEMSRLNVLNCRVRLKDNRLMTGGGGGVICQASRIGPWVEGCDFEGLADDCLNIYAVPIYVLKQVSSTQMIVRAKAAVLPGDHLVFFNPREGAVIQETTVVSFSGNTLVLSDPVGPLHIAPEGTAVPKGDLRSWKSYDHAYNLNSVGNDFVYRNNFMHDGRRYGALLRAGNGLIECNRFEGLSHPGIALENEPGWPEGFWAQNLIISSNRVTECGYIGRKPCIQITSLKLGGVMNTPIQKNIFLLNNQFSSVSGPAMMLSGVSGLTAAGNEFSSGSASGPLVTVQYSTNIVWTNNAGQERVQFK